MKKIFLSLFIMPLAIAITSGLNNNTNEVVETHAMAPVTENYSHDFETNLDIGLNTAIFNSSLQIEEPYIAREVGIALSHSHFLKHELKGYIVSDNLEIQLLATTIFSPSRTLTVDMLDVFGNTICSNEITADETGHFSLTVPQKDAANASSFIIYNFEDGISYGMFLKEISVSYDYMMTDPLNISYTNIETDEHNRITNGDNFPYNGLYSNGQLHIANNVLLDTVSPISNKIYVSSLLGENTVVTREEISVNMTLSSTSAISSNYDFTVFVVNELGEVVASGTPYTVNVSLRDELVTLTVSLTDVPHFELLGNYRVIVNVDYDYDKDGTDVVILSKLTLSSANEAVGCNPKSREFINLVMFSNEEGTCNTRFYQARDLFLGLPTRYQDAMKNPSETVTSYKRYNMSNAHLGIERYLAWATALGEDPFSNTYSYQTNKYDAKGSSILIISISALCFASIGSFVVYKKKKIR